jgi:HK97 family phage major capsid protein
MEILFMAAKRGRKKVSLEDLSVRELQALLEKKTAEESKKLPELKKRRKELEEEIARVESEISAIESFGGAAPAKRAGRPRKESGAKRGPGRPKKAAAKKTGAAKPSRRGRRAGGGMSLREAIAAVLRDASGPMSPTEIRDEIVSKGLYGEPTKTFYQQVVLRLRQSPEFKVVSRGQYALK